ncbi:MAG: ATP-dependent helicase HrpB [Actinomycetota bacterium]|nr:ATP-dependent helicase HrpB [Actinomycetota bacterium]
MTPVPVPPAAADLPVAGVLDDVRAALADAGSVVVVAPPGSGKTTLVPLALLGESWLGDGRIVVTEPRRLAARAAAQRMAELLGEPVGRTVGYSVRQERRTSASTRIEVVTEGLLVRRLQADPSLDGIGAVLADEVHERSVDLDLALAMALDARDGLRDDLRLGAMSATIDPTPIAAWLGAPRSGDAAGPAPVVTAEGRTYPVEVRHVGRPRPGGDRGRAAVDAAVDATIAALGEIDGGVLVFLPGEAEIRRVVERLAGRVTSSVDVVALYGALGADDQDRALAPSPAGRRKVVVASAIAESSLTVPGIAAVVDAGLARRPRHDPGSGLSRLETVPVSAASADQRAGRAGRLGPGLALRLWDPTDRLRPLDEPEILSADLAGLALEVAAWGTTPDELRWLDPPPAAALAVAGELLVALGAIDDRGRCTADGHAMVALGAHPRIAHLLVRAAAAGHTGEAADLAAVLSENDLVAAPAGDRSADLGIRLDVLGGRRPPPGHETRRAAVARARRQARAWTGRLGGPGSGSGPGTGRRGQRKDAADVVDVGRLLVWAYPDRVARRRPTGAGGPSGAGDDPGGEARYLLANGRGARLRPRDPLAGEEWLVVASLDGGGDGRADGRIHLAAATSAEVVVDELGDRVLEADVVRWDEQSGEVVAQRQRSLGAIVLRASPLDTPPPELLASALADAVRSRGLDLLGRSDAARDLATRVGFLHGIDPSWPDLTDDALVADVDDWLPRHLGTARRVRDLGRVDLRNVMAERVGWQRLAEVDRLAPTHVELPTGRRAALRYEEDRVVLSVRLQEMLGASAGPTVAGGRVPVTLELLSPARRPIQVTTDLAGFWAGSYAQVRAEMRGRYPKHPWPEDPANATPTTRTKRAEGRRTP